ncbi:energy transducer TonB [Gillisia hiemivivida]|uniref:Energy transducer TonB n=1 Tax=Gillisia hiemivivida TaxID=291190 RepID=A0A5C6ZVB1_9FLAO|nr:energy transducer TonB [Gillisia hiemivivida]TXD94834.1 energy transducer TonB [Gillisia hiemivivida]
MKNLLFIAALILFTTASQAQEGVTVKGNTITMKDIGPVWPGCEKSELSAEDCFNKQLAKHVKSNFKYPKDANGKIVRGKSVITFYIDENGKVCKVSAEGSEKLVNQEAVRITKLFPVMKPGNRGGKKIEVKYKMPFNF